MKQIPLGRFGSGEDVANVVAFLCSEARLYSGRSDFRGRRTVYVTGYVSREADFGLHLR